MEKKYRRIIAVLLGVCLWIFYIFQEEMADYGLYTLFSYRVHEIASLIPYAALGVSVIWAVCLLARIARRDADRADKIFFAVLLILSLAQRDQIWKRETSAVTVAVVESVDDRRGTLRIRVGKEETVVLEAPEIVRDMVETDEQEYLITYTFDERLPGTGKLNMIRRVP